MRELFYTLFRYKDKKSPDKLGLFPGMVHIDSMPERRYLWASRLLVIFAGTSIAINMMLASTLYLLLPQRGAWPQLLYTDNDFSLLRNVEKAEINVSVQKLITEFLIEKYVRLRHEVIKDPLELVYRWEKGSEFYELTTTMEYQKFTSKYRDNVYTYINDFANRYTKREVTIDWIKQLSPETWQAQFSTLSYPTNGKKPQLAIWRAHLRVRDKKLDEENKVAVRGNPYGIKIYNYSLSYVGNGKKSADYLKTAQKATQKELFEEAK